MITCPCNVRIHVPLESHLRDGVVVESRSKSKGPGFDPHKRHHVVSLSNTHFKTPSILVKPRNRWLRPDMTEKLLIGTLSLN